MSDLNFIDDKQEPVQAVTAEAHALNNQAHFVSCVAEEDLDEVQGRIVVILTMVCSGGLTSSSEYEKCDWWDQQVFYKDQLM
jgi:hypothetical protein